jgi:hypothetical protein
MYFIISYSYFITQVFYYSPASDKICCMCFQIRAVQNYFDPHVKLTYKTSLYADLDEQ